MKKRVSALFLICLITGCSNNETKEETVVSDDEITEENSADNVFENVTEIEFCLSGTDGKIEIDSDGNFKGLYREYDLNETGEEFPNGTYYYSVFEGKFSRPEKTEDNIYSFKIESISFDEESETTKKGAKCITYITEGWEEENEIFLFPPGTAKEELTDGYNTLWTVYSNKEDDVLPYYGLYNPSARESFEGREKCDYLSLEEETEAAENTGSYWENVIYNDEDYNEMMKASYEFYLFWNLKMNSFWYRIFDSAEEEELTLLTEEQRQWLSYEKNEEEKAGEEFEGGSLYILPVNQTGGKLFRERALELTEYVKKYEQ